MADKKRVRFCDINPVTYAISVKKEIAKRRIENARSSERFATARCEEKLPVVLSHKSNILIKTGKGVDPVLQQNKVVNLKIASEPMNGLVIHPGETFSFFKLTGKITPKKGYKAGRVIQGGKLVPDVGGGLCNLANTIHLLVLDSPLDVTEFHTHSDALAPDHGKRVPMSAGTSVGYNYVDFRFKNNTDQDFQLLIWFDEERMYGELCCEREIPLAYEIVEEDHHFEKEGEDYYRVSKIYRDVKDKSTGAFVRRDLIWDNRSKVMFDPSEIPADQIRE